MPDSAKFKNLLDRFAGEVFVAIVIALIGVAFYMGTIDSKVGRFDDRLRDLERLDGIRSEKEEAIEAIGKSKEKSVESASKTIEGVLNQAKTELFTESRALLKDGIENIIDAKRLAIEEIRESKAQDRSATSSVTPEKLPSPPESKLERDLKNVFENVQEDSESHLIVHQNKTYSVNSPDLKFLSVTLQENSTLVVPSKFTKFTLRTMKFVTGKGALVVARGEVGSKGNDGRKGKNGSTCVDDGDNGEHGGPGGRGKSGTSVEIFAIDFVLADSLIVDTSGGTGGNGGRGGNGGNGGEASRSRGCGGGAGGAGGVGGSAGDGGNSGALSIHYVRGYSSGKELIILPIVRTLVEHMAAPGTVGLPGDGGNGGFGGPGIARKSLPRGVDGIDGSTGEPGSPGTRGSTTVASVQTIGR